MESVNTLLYVIRCRCRCARTPTTAGGNIDKNHYAAEAIKLIMRTGTSSQNLANPLFIDYKLASGLGVRFNLSTNEFIGFLGRGL